MSERQFSKLIQEGSASGKSKAHLSFIFNILQTKGRQQSEKIGDVCWINRLVRKYNFAILFLILICLDLLHISSQFNALSISCYCENVLILSAKAPLNCGKWGRNIAKINGLSAAVRDAGKLCLVCRSLMFTNCKCCVHTCGAVL